MFHRFLCLASILPGFIVAGPALPQEPATPPSPAALWPELLQFDAAKAYRAMRQLAATPGETVRYLRDVVPPATKTATEKQIADLIHQLDSDRFGEREKARQELERLDWQAAPALRKAVEAGGTLELKRRLEQLIARTEGPLTGTNLRRHRAVEVVEWLGTTEAKALLERWGQGAPASRLTVEANKALKRWDARPQVNTQDKRPTTDAQGDPLPAGAILRLGSTRWRMERGSIGYERGGLVYTSDSKKLLIAGVDAIGMMDAASGKVLMRRAYQGSISGMQLSPDGRRLLISSVVFGNNVRTHFLHVWDAADLKEIATWLAEGSIEGFADDGKHAVLGTEKGIRRIDLATGHEVSFTAFPKGAEGIVRAFNGKTVVTNRRNRLTVFDLSSPAKIQNLDVPDRDPRSVALSANGKYLAIGGEFDYGVLIYDLVRGQPIRYVSSKEARRDFVVSLTFSPDSKSLAFCSGYEKPALVLWDLETHRPRWKAEASAGQLAFSPDGKLLAANSGWRTRVWDAATGKELSGMGDLPAGDVRELAFTSDGRRIFDMNSDAARIWEFPSGKLAKAFSESRHTEGALSPQPKLTTAALSPDGRRVATATFSGIIRMWDATTGKEMDSLPGPAPYMSGMAFSTDSRQLVTWGMDLTIRRWDVENGRLLAENRPKPEGLPDIDFDDAKARRRRGVDGVDLVPFRSALIAQGSRLVWRFKKLHIYDTRSGGELAVFDEPTQFHYHGVKTSDDVEWLLLGGDPPAVLYNLRQGKRFGHVEIGDSSEGGTGHVALSQDGRCFSVGTYHPSAKIHVYETVTLQRRLTIPLDHGYSRVMTFSPEGRFLAAAHADGTVLVWDLRALGE
jgi:WD40 repeat protein